MVARIRAEKVEIEKQAEKEESGHDVYRFQKGGSAGSSRRQPARWRGENSGTLLQSSENLLWAKWSRSARGEWETMCSKKSKSAWTNLDAGPF